MTPMLCLAILAGQGDLQFIVMTLAVWNAHTDDYPEGNFNDYLLNAMTLDSQKEYPDDVTASTPTAEFVSMNIQEFVNYLHEQDSIDFEETFKGHIY